MRENRDTNDDMIQIIILYHGWIERTSNILCHYKYIPSSIPMVEYDNLYNIVIGITIFSYTIITIVRDIIIIIVVDIIIVVEINFIFMKLIMISLI